MKRILIPAIALILSTGIAYADGDKKLEKSVQINRETAKTIATAEVPGTVVDIDLEKRKGKVFWCVDVKPTDAKQKMKEVCIDANTGDILSVKEDTDDDDDKDKD